jgi:excisionase family DNA binding protein
MSITVTGRRGEGMEDKLTLSVEETAKLLGIGRNLCYDRVKTGEIPVIKIGRRLLIPRAALDRLLNSTSNMTNFERKRQNGI